MILDLSLSVPMDHPIFEMASQDQYSLASVGHVGTHLDTYLQSPIPLDYFRRPGRIIDTRPVVDANGEIGLDVLEGQRVKSGEFLVFYTGWLQKHEFASKGYFGPFPQLTWELIDHLISLDLSFIGVDSPGVRRDHEEHIQTDKRAEETGTYIIENIANADRLLDAVGDGEFTLFTGWTGPTGYSGLSCRLIADIPS